MSALISSQLSSSSSSAPLACGVWACWRRSLGSPSHCGSAQVRSRVLLTVDDIGTPRLRLESGQAFAQLAVRTDGMAVLLLSDGNRQRQATLLPEGLRLEHGGRVVGQVR